MNRRRFQAIASLGFALILILDAARLAPARPCWPAAASLLISFSWFGSSQGGLPRRPGLKGRGLFSFFPSRPCHCHGLGTFDLLVTLRKYERC